MGIVVAIDGPSGAGKSSTSKAIALRANWNYLDTGALYRGVAWLALKKKASTPQQILTALSDSPLKFVGDPTNAQLFAGDVDITSQIRSAEVTNKVSEVSALPEVREVLLILQRKMIAQAQRGIVVEGRDIGTVVVPDAALKLFLTADLEARAIRRDAELVIGQSSSQVEIVSQSLAQRDHTDSTRATSPLAMASDAIEIDSTSLNLEETAERIWELLRERRLLGLPIVAVLGRPNVGKSTLINRFLGRREAIVEDTPGVTRDRVTYECTWNGRDFMVMDTGGWESKPDGISIGVSLSAELAMQEADVLLFVVDSHVGALDEDDVLVHELRQKRMRYGIWVWESLHLFQRYMAEVAEIFLIELPTYYLKWVGHRFRMVIVE